MKTAALCMGAVALAGSAFGQAIIERGAAAVTGSSAGVGIGKSIGGILKGVDRAADAAANQGKDYSVIPTAPSLIPKIKNPALNLTLPPGQLIKQNMGIVSTRQAIGPALPPTPVAAAIPVPVVSEPAPVLPPFNPEGLQEIREGATRDELVSKVGTPFFKMTLPDGNHAVEIYRYRANGQDAAVVKLFDGVITSVEVLAR